MVTLRNTLSPYRDERTDESRTTVAIFRKDGKLRWLDGKIGTWWFLLP